MTLRWSSGGHCREGRIIGRYFIVLIRKLPIMLQCCVRVLEQSSSWKAAKTNSGIRQNHLVFSLLNRFVVKGDCSSMLPIQMLHITTSMSSSLPKHQHKKVWCWWYQRRSCIVDVTRAYLGEGLHLRWGSCRFFLTPFPNTKFTYMHIQKGQNHVDLLYGNW